VRGIGTLNESPLHAAVKDYLAADGDRFEVDLDGFVVDIVRGDELIEIQTRNFASLGRKLDRLLDAHTVTLVHPIAARTVINRPDRNPRRSPKKGSMYSLFDELVSIPTMLDHPRLTLEVLLIEEAQERRHDPSLRRRRGGWRIVERKLEAVIEQRRFRSGSDLAALLPDDLPDTFTTADLAHDAGISRPLAQKMAYCLRHLGQIEAMDRRKDGIRYQRLS
jgi:hypothetical protein